MVEIEFVLVVLVVYMAEHKWYTFNTVTATRQDGDNSRVRNPKIQLPLFVWTAFLICSLSRLRNWFAKAHAFI